MKEENSTTPHSHTVPLEDTLPGPHLHRQGAQQIFRNLDSPRMQQK